MCYHYFYIILRRIYTDTRIAGTQVLQGNLDTTGEIFDKTVASLLAGETEHIWQKYNSQGSPWGSHIR